MGDASVAGTTPVPGRIPPLPLVKSQDGFGDADFWGMRGTIVYQPTSATRITAEVNYGRDKGARKYPIFSIGYGHGMVEPRGIEPLTFAMPLRRSPS